MYIIMIPTMHIIYATVAISITWMWLQFNFFFFGVSIGGQY